MTLISRLEQPEAATCSDCDLWVARSNLGDEWCDAFGMQMPGCTDGAENCAGFVRAIIERDSNGK